MSASTYDYKTVALPQTVQGKRRRGVSEADLVAETLGELIHIEAVDGWEYMRSDVLAAGTRGGMFSKEPTVTYYTVLVFRRMQEGVWPLDQARPTQAPAANADIESVTPIAAPVAPKPPVSTAPAPKTAVATPPPAPVEPAAPVTPPAAVARVADPEPAIPMIGDPTSPLTQGGLLTTGGQFSTNTGGGSTIKPRPAPKTAPRPPLGSAQD